MRVDLRSDTVTRPTPTMRRAMAEAEVGDDVFGDDPTVNRLEAVAAERLGKAAALFTPSGTMANQIAIRLHTQPGDAMVLEAGAHPFHYEAGAPAWLSGVSLVPVPGPGGILDPDRAAQEFRAPDPHLAPVTLIGAEDTANAAGGRVYPLEVLDRLGELARSQQARAHLDGARLFNAVVASRVPAARRAQAFDTVCVCLSKGLGAPVGSLLAGPTELILRARRIRKGLGGGMRQAGILAAAGLHALEHHVERLAEDHARAQRLAEGLRDLGYSVTPPETNMVYLEAPRATELVAQLSKSGVLACASGERVRLVTHLDVDDAGIAHTLRRFEELSEDR